MSHCQQIHTTENLMNPSDNYQLLSFYTLSLQDKDYIHQHIVDAYTAQTAGQDTKPIALFFSLVGLYLLNEKQYSGRQIQQAHQMIASKTKKFIPIRLPDFRGEITVNEVLKEPEGAERNLMIKTWSLSVWNAYSDEHSRIIKETHQLLFDPNHITS